MQGFPKGVRSAAHPPALDKSCENCVSLFLELMVQFVYEDDEAAAGVSGSRLIFAVTKLPFSPACQPKPSPFPRVTAQTASARIA